MYQNQDGLETGATPPVGGTNVINVGQLERLASVGMGIGLMSGAMKHKGFLKCAFLLGAGAYMFYRGATGNCPLSARLDLRGSNIQGKRAALAEIRSTLSINRPAGDAYNFWRKLDNLPRFMKHLQSVEKIGPVKSRWTAKFPGAPAAISWDAEIISDIPGSLIAWQSLPGSAVENAGEVKFRDAPGGQGAEVDVILTYRPPAGKVGEGIAKLLNPVLEDLVREDIRNFKQYIESGEIPTIKGQPSGRKDDLA
ncbi:MAG TPA: SRPBCC family protein [Anseongella sp.]|nr:SRPBCC family protein [Anseongella sp.]